ncbi:hypothetical protein [Nesterenkonia sp.]|uniref:hypothetical protein n=1 Tax=Nesterenkonia sp. TaxID=704201 RepID=UPI00260A352E|nr:hypothetical protein [Nesterenkonia sp.]
MSTVAYLEPLLSRSRPRRAAGERLVRPFGRGAGKQVEDQPLPLEGLPAPKPKDVRSIVLDRDGRTCRACGGEADLQDRHSVFGGRIVSLFNKTAGELPELDLVVMCDGCADRAEKVKQRSPGQEASVDGWLVSELYMQRLLGLLYLENCSMAGANPIRAEVILR